MTPAELRRIRKALGLSQADLAAALGWSSKVSVSRLETGTRPIMKQTELALKALVAEQGENDE